MLTTARLVLRPFVAADLGAFLSYRRDPEVARYQSWSESFSEADGRAFIEAVSTTAFGTPGAWVNLAVELCASGELIGDVALRVAPDASDAEIGFTLSRAHRARGYATEATRALCHDALSRARKLVAITDARNAPSIRLLERIGFRQVGFHARQITFKGELCDELRFERSQ